MIIIIIVSMPDPQGLSQLSQISMQPSSSSLFPQQDQCMSFHYKGLLMLMTSLVLITTMATVVLTTTMLLTMMHYSPESWQVVNMEYLHWGYGICKGCRYVLSIEY